MFKITEVFFPGRILSPQPKLSIEGESSSLQFQVTFQLSETTLLILAKSNDQYCLIDEGLIISISNSPDHFPSNS